MATSFPSNSWLGESNAHLKAKIKRIKPDTPRRLLTNFHMFSDELNPPRGLAELQFQIHFASKAAAHAVGTSCRTQRFDEYNRFTTTTEPMR